MKDKETYKDKDLWDRYTKTLKPVKQQPIKSIKAKVLNEKSAARQAAEKGPSQSVTINSENQLKVSLPSSLERKREKALRQGNIVIEGKLDLHGMTLTKAHEALENFMHRSTKEGWRSLLIVTGKGRDGKGVLKTNLENWLKQSSQARALLALRPAAPKHGGEGAFYVLLRKK